MNLRLYTTGALRGWRKHFESADTRVWWNIAAGTLILTSFFPIFLYLAGGSPAEISLLCRLTLRLSWLPFISMLQFSARRWPLSGPRFVRNVINHTLAGTAFIVVHTGITATILATDKQFARPGASSHFADNWVNGFQDLQLFSFTLLWYVGALASIYAFRYYYESQEKTASLIQLNARLVESRLQALRNQLNPHFLFNTLNSISALALQGDSRRVTEMLAGLSTLLRTALDDTRPDVIPLEEELKFITTYIDLQRIRFADRLTVTWEVDPGITSSRVPSMILQPLVENAIQHGVCARTGPAELVVRARASGDRLQMEVADSGPGFGATNPTLAMKHVGLRNTEARLEQMYGVAHRIDYLNNGHGASVRISIPLA